MKRNCKHCAWNSRNNCPCPQVREEAQEYCSDMGHYLTAPDFTLQGLELSKEPQQGLDRGFIDLPSNLYNPDKWTPLYVKNLKTLHGYDSLEVIDWGEGYYLLLGKRRTDCRLKFQFTDWLSIYKAEQDIKDTLHVLVQPNT